MNTDSDDLAVPSEVGPSVFVVEKELMERVYRTLQFYANETSYQGERIGGVLAGCPRGPAPSASEMTFNAVVMVRQLEEKLRD